MNRRAIPAAVCAMAALVGCGSVANIRQEIEDKKPDLKRTFDEPAVRPVAQSRVTEISGPMIPVTKVALPKDSNAWLRAKRTDYYNSPKPTSISRFVESLAAKGVNIVSDLPLENLTFTGSVSSTDAETALRIVLGSAGLDYVVDDRRQIVTIKPLPSKSWALNIGNRRSSYSSGQVSVSQAQTQSSSNGNSGAQGNSGQTGSSSQGTNSQAGGAGYSGGSTSGQQSGSQQNSGSTTGGTLSGTASSGVQADDDFWGEMSAELEKRLKVAVPNARPGATNGGGSNAAFPSAIPGMPTPPMQLQPQLATQGQPGQENSQTNDLYELKRIGAFSINRVTGAIRVQAPAWMLQELDTYIRGIQEMYDAVISFDGELVLFNQARKKSEALDFQNFIQWAGGRYGAVLSNNVLGGVAVNFSEGNIPNVSASGQFIPGPLLGIRSAPDGLQVFNNYLDSLGNYSVKERVKVTVSSGVPGVMSTMAPMEYQEVQQNAVAGNVGAAQQSTNYVTKTKDFGTVLRVYPRYDLATGKVRAQVDILNNIYAGDKTFQQKFGIGNTVLTVNNVIPQTKTMNYSGEAQMKAGDLVVLGGQSLDTLQSDESGLPIGSAPLGGLFGSKTASVTKGYYYFVLHVTVSKR